LRSLGEELAFSRITADLVDDVDRRAVWSGSCKREWQLRPRMQCSFLCVTPQDWPRWRVLVLDYLLDDAMRHALEFVHQVLRVPMKRMGHHVVHLLTQGSGAFFRWYRQIYIVQSAFW